MKTKKKSPAKKSSNTAAKKKKTSSPAAKKKTTSSGMVKKKVGASSAKKKSASSPAKKKAAPSTAVKTKAGSSSRTVKMKTAQASSSRSSATSGQKKPAVSSGKTSAKKTIDVQKRVTTVTSAPAKNKGKENNKKFPGYPQYSPNEDIMEQGKRVDQNLDDEVLTDLKRNRSAVLDTSPIKEADRTISSESDLTDEDREALGPKDLSMDMGEDEELLKHRDRPVDFTGKDLDIPGSELDDAQESIGSEDEENNLYSQGGDDKENLEERQD